MSRTTKFAAAAASAAAAATAVVGLSAAPALAGVTPGAFTATLQGNMVINAGVTANCTSSVLKGSVAADGTTTKYTSATAGGCGVTVTPSGLPWSGSINAGVVKINGFKMSAIGCTYGGNLTGSYTPTTANFPLTVTFTNQTVTKTSGLLCPSSATVTATYKYTQP
ncbi:hypothetical protein [Actinomadura chokoriensis]|uniref:Protein activator of alkane oxidation PraB n=1 Tax=Actinomadura chokoriensis TaxID=454156 RepID=A0ABV4QRG7_9ACTN